MIVASAVVGIVLGGYLLRMRAVTYRQKVAAYIRCEEACERYRTMINDDLRVIEKNEGGHAELQAARNLEGMFLVRRSSRGELITSAETDRRFASSVSPERLATLRKLGHEESDFYEELAESHRWNRKIYEKATRYPWMSVSGTVPEPK